MHASTLFAPRWCIEFENNWYSQNKTVGYRWWRKGLSIILVTLRSVSKPSRMCGDGGGE